MPVHVRARLARRYASQEVSFGKTPGRSGSVDRLVAGGRKGQMVRKMPGTVCKEWSGIL